MSRTRPSTVKSSVRRWLWVLVAAVLALQGAELWLSLDALDNLSSLSGYRRDLEDSSRARSAAAGHLHQLIETGDPAEWEGFLARIRVLEGFEGTRGSLVEELRGLGFEIDSRLLAGALEPAEADSFHRRIGELERELETIELTVSDMLQESREALERRFRTEQLTALALLLALVLGLGLWTSLRLNREMGHRQEAERALSASQERLRDTEITERKRAEKERQRLEERLREVERLEALGRLAGGVAHDFNNLLTAILGHCDLAAGMIEAESPALSQVEEVKRAARRAADLTRQLLAFSRRQAIEPRVLDLNHAVGEVTSLLRRLIGEDVRVELHLRASPATVLLDPSQVDQLLVNLAVNARDAMPGGGRIAIETGLKRRNGDGPDGPVDLPAGEYIVLTVSDTGQGMDPVTRKHAFEPFFTTKPKGKGTGLGLATVYGIVKQNGGFIDVDSEPGAGTSFRIFLPKAEGAVEEERDDRAGPSAPRGSATVLLVEDEPAVRDLVRRLLAEHGYSVLEAAEGTAALALFEEHHVEIDLLITDLMLPGISGDALAARIAEARPDLPTLFISGYSESFLGERGVVREGVRLLQKPFGSEELLSRVEKLLRAPAGHAPR